MLRIKRDVAHVDDIADMRSVPLVRLGEIVAEDVVRAVGTVAPADSLLVAPVSGRPCVYYEVVVRPAHDAEPIIAWSDIRAFDLDDGSGRAYVQPPCPIIMIAERVRETGAPTSGYRDAPSQVVFETDERAPLSLSDDASLVAQ